MKQEIFIDNHVIGLGKPVYISAEVGTTHNGDLSRAKELIDAALYAGMDAAKFQIMGAEEIHSDHSERYTYRTAAGETKSENIVEMYKKYQFSLDQWRELKEHADKRKISMFVSVDHPEALEIGEAIGVPAYKICSWDLNYFPFIKAVARLGKPVVLDAGTADIQEFAKVLTSIQEEGNEEVVVLHCWHADDAREINLKSIPFIRDTFQVLTGLSAADRNSEIDFASVAFEPVMIEQRLTLNRNDSEHHHALALEPEEMKQYVEKIRRAQAAVGEYGLYPSRKDREGKERYWRRIVANRDIKKGEKFTKENIECKRPRTGGLDPSFYEFVLGREAKRDLKENTPITKEDI